MSLILPARYGRKLFLKPIFLTFFLLAFPLTPSLQGNCISQSKKYVPVRSLWLNRVFSDLANSHEKHCLTIDGGYLNKNGPCSFRSSAENPEKQVCYFNKRGDDVFHNTFISERIKEGENSEGI